MSDIEITNTKRPTKPAKADAPADGKVRIVIQKTKEDTRDVFVQVNFKPYLIKRGVPVEVPPEVVEALNNAVQVTYVGERGPDGRIELTAQDTPSYPFQFA